MKSFCVINVTSFITGSIPQTNMDHLVDAKRKADCLLSANLGPLFYRLFASASNARDNNFPRLVRFPFDEPTALAL